MSATHETSPTPDKPRRHGSTPRGLATVGLVLFVGGLLTASFLTGEGFAGSWQVILSWALIAISIGFVVAAAIVWDRQRAQVTASVASDDTDLWRQAMGEHTDLPQTPHTHS